MRRVYPRGTRRLVTCHARCHGGARICQRTYERDALQGGAWYHGQIIRICRQKYDDSRPTAGAMGGSLQQPPAAMLEISRRHSVMLHGSCIPSFEIERATMNGHDQRGPSRASLHGLRSEVYMPQTGKFGLLFQKNSAQTQKGFEFILSGPNRQFDLGLSAIKTTCFRIHRYNQRHQLPESPKRREVFRGAKLWRVHLRRVRAPGRPRSGFVLSP